MRLMGVRDLELYRKQAFSDGRRSRGPATFTVSAAAPAAAEVGTPARRCVGGTGLFASQPTAAGKVWKRIDMDSVT